jgi:hypothetical protein
MIVNHRNQDDYLELLRTNKIPRSKSTENINSNIYNSDNGNKDGTHSLDSSFNIS